MLGITTVGLLATTFGLVDSPFVEVDSVVLTLVEQVDVPAKEMGVLTEVHVREGQPINKGDLLAKVDDDDAVREQRRAKIELQRASEQADNTTKLEQERKTLALAELELERVKAARRKFDKAVSESELQRLQLEVDKSQLAIKQAEHELRQARLTAQYSENELHSAEAKLKRCRISSPINGYIEQMHRRPGEWVQPGEMVFSVLRLDVLRAEGFVDSRNLGQLAIGQTVEFEVTIPGEGRMKFPGVLQFISKKTDPIDGKTRIWAELPNAKMLLRPGLRGSMTVSTPNAATFGN